MPFCFLDPQRLEHLCEAINTDAEFRLASRFFSTDILIVAGDARCIVKARDGKIREIVLNPAFTNPWSFCIKGSIDSWGRFLQAIPPPTYTDLYGCI